jgi:hypothetical protein
MPRTMSRTILRTMTRLAASLVVLAASAGLSTSADAATRTPWKVTIRSADTRVTLGDKVHLHGHVARGAAGLLVTLQERVGPNRPWRDQRQARVHRGGGYRTYDVPSRNTSRLYRVVMPRTDHHSRGVSEPLLVVVYQWKQLTSFPQSNPSFLPAVTSVPIDGISYPASLEATTFHPNGPTTQSVEYNLNHKCLRFRGTFGLSDNSESGSQASVEAEADGAPWFSQAFSIGGSTHNAFDFGTAPLKVHLQTTSLVDGLDGFGAVGTPEVYCTQ